MNNNLKKLLTLSDGITYENNKYIKTSIQFIMFLVLKIKV